MRAMLAALLLSGCVSVGGSGCLTYGAQRQDMPRPLPADDLGRWVAVTDTAMTKACRP